MANSTSTTPATEPVDAAGILSFDTRMDCLVENMASTIAGIKSWQKELKELKKEYAKEKKALLKNSKKKSPQSAEAKANSSFSKPQVLSAEIKTFLKLEDDAMLSRTNVTKMLNTFVRDNDLLLADNKRIINVWAKTPEGESLKKLLKPNPGDEVTWFNLQKYLACHYPKPKDAAPKVEPVASVPTPKPEVVTKAPSVKRARTARVRAAGTA